MVRRRLDVELVRRGLVSSRSRAVEAVDEGRVTVAGAPTRSAARQVDEHEPIVVNGAPPRFVSRGGDKLDAALDQFALDVRGARALDAGSRRASPGIAVSRTDQSLGVSVDRCGRKASRSTWISLGAVASRCGYSESIWPGSTSSRARLAWRWSRLFS